MSSSLGDRFLDLIYEKGYGSAAFHLTNIIHGGTSVVLAVSYAPVECCRALQDAGGRVLLLNNGWIHLVDGPEALLHAAEKMKPLEEACE